MNKSFLSHNLETQSFLVAEIGDDCVKLGEFEQTLSGGLIFKNCMAKPVKWDDGKEQNWEAVVQALSLLISEGSFSAKDVYLCAPARFVFSRIIRLPPMTTNKLREVVESCWPDEADVRYDYAYLRRSKEDELFVLTFAVMGKIVRSLLQSVKAAGLRPKLVDPTDAALGNAFWFNNRSANGCTLLLYIDRSSHALFFDKEDFYCRTINIGEAAFKSDLSTRLGSPISEEQWNVVQHGFQMPNTTDIFRSKVSESTQQVASRLLKQVNQTLQFYRSQQGGVLPTRLVLGGSMAALPGLTDFFAKELYVDTTLWNPLQNIETTADFDKSEAARKPHSLGVIAGLALRHARMCPFEIDLSPKELGGAQQFYRSVRHRLSQFFR